MVVCLVLTSTGSTQIETKSAFEVRALDLEILNTPKTCDGVMKR